MKKKWWMLSMMACAVFALTACGDNPSDGNAGDVGGGVLIRVS